VAGKYARTFTCSCLLTVVALFSLDFQAIRISFGVGEDNAKSAEVQNKD
jgi:hypothetical protein